MTDEQLVQLARDAAKKAYAPYSKFNVGCAIESVDGEVVTGANMENACYRLGICAEQSALTAAQHQFGLDKVARIAVSGGEDSMCALPAAAVARQSSKRRSSAAAMSRSYARAATARSSNVTRSEI